MSLLIITATLLGGVVLGAAITVAAFWLAAVRELADTAKEK